MKMNSLKEIQDFIENIAKTEIQKVQIKTDNFEINVQLKPEYNINNGQILMNPQISSPHINQNIPKQEYLEPIKEQSSQNENLIKIKSPMVGTFYRKPSPDKPAFVEKGQTIKKGDVVCIIEAMKLFNEIESEIEGVIVDVLVNDASPVEFDQVLFLVKP